MLALLSSYGVPSLIGIFYFRFYLILFFEIIEKCKVRIIVSPFFQCHLCVMGGGAGERKREREERKKEREKKEERKRERKRFMDIFPCTV